MKKHLTGFSLLVFISVFIACNSNGKKELRKACLDFDVIRNGKLVRIDSCFTAPTSDSLEKIIAIVRAKQAEPREVFETKLLFIIVDTLGKSPEQYEYAMVVSDAGTINNEVILTQDISFVKEKSAPFAPGNIIFKKLIVGETTKGCVETIFKTNVRINYRTVSNKKVNS